MIDRKKILKYLVFSIVLLSFVNFLAIDFGWYYIYPYFDVLMHFWGGLSVFYLINYIFYKRFSLDKPKFLQMIIFVFLIGVSWEIYEYVLVNIWAGNPFNRVDTFYDLVFDVLGGIYGILTIKNNGK